MILLGTFVLVGAVSASVSFGLGWFFKPNKTIHIKDVIYKPLEFEKYDPVRPHPRGGSTRVLRFGFTLNGEDIGEMIPQDADPIKIAAQRSLLENKNYGARRI